MESTITQAEHLIELISTAKKMEAINPQEAFQQTEKALELAIHLEHIEAQIECLVFLARLYRNSGTTYKSLSKLTRVLHLVNTHFPNADDKIAPIYKELGVVYADGLRDFSTALDYCFKALKYNIPTLNIYLHNNIGSIYKDSEQTDNAIEYLEKGESLAITAKEYHVLAYILENLGGVYYQLGEYSKAKEYLLRGQEVAEQEIQTNQPGHYVYSLILTTLGRCFLKMENYEEAKFHFEKALKISKEQGFEVLVVYALVAIGDYHFARNEESEFLNIHQAALDYSRQHNLFIERKSCLNQLKDFYEEKENYKEAYFLAKEIIRVQAEHDALIEDKSMADVLTQRESEIMKLEENNRKINLQKEELEQFAYIVAHDLKEPLRNMGNYSGLLKKRYSDSLDKHGQEFVDFISTNAEHMYLMLDDLLRFATLQKLEDAIGMVDTERLLIALLHRMQDEIKSCNATVDYQDLPLLNIRGMHLEILFQNLIHNALKFRKPNQAIKLNIRAESNEEYICIKVQDDGIGIAPEYHHRIFQLFKRLDKKRYKGTGMGLALCKKIVEYYNGAIWVESEEGKGSCFCFKFPKKK